MKPALKQKTNNNSNNKGNSSLPKQKQRQPALISLIDKSQKTNNQNQTLISKMMGLSVSASKIIPQQKSNPSSNFHGGGFNLNNNSSYITNKNNNYNQYQKVLERVSYQNASHFQIPVQPSHLYQQLGISTSGIKDNSKFKKSKYRQDEPGQIVLNKIDQQIEQMNNQRKRKFMNMQTDNWVYKLADSQNRHQSAVHVQSTLQQMNLQNVQAKLTAHRMKIRQIQQQYAKKHGKKFDPSSRYLDDPNYSQNTSIGLKFNIDIDKQFAQLEAQKGRVYELAKKRQDQQPQQMDLDQLWEQKKLSNPKLAQYDKKYKQYLLQKQAKGLISRAVRQRLFTWDKYIQPGHKKKLAPYQGASSFQRNNKKSKSKQKNKEQSPIKQNDYGNINDLGQVLATKNDNFISGYIISQIDKQKRGLVSKEELYEYIKENEKILRGYRIDMKWLFTDLDNYETQRKGMLNKLQIAKFLALLQKVMHPQMKIHQPNKIKQNENNFLFNEKLEDKPYTTTFLSNKFLFEKLFQALDLGDDKLIKRQQFIQNIYTDSEIGRIIDKQAINIKIIDKTITYRQIIGAVIDDYRNQKNQKLKKSKQYITFGRFCQYFQIPQSLDLKKLQKHKKKTKNQNASTQFQIMDLSSQYLQLMKDIAATIPRVYQDYLTSVDFIETCLRDPQIIVISQQLCRIESIQTKLPAQSIQATLTRMLKQCDEYSTWDQLKMYLSRRGRPLNWDYQIIMKKKALRQSKMKQHVKNISASKLFNKTDTALDAFRDTRKSLSKQKYKNGHYDKYTIPQPFKITDQEKKKGNKNKQKDSQSAELQELRKKFKAKPINKQIFESKPQLIQGKMPKKNQELKPDYYKYENYQNDRIERALKKAQQKYQLEQQIRTAKQKAEVKARQIGIDLTKKYNDVIKQQQKKKRAQSQKKKPTNPSVSKNLYPDDPAGLAKRKIEKVEQNMKKADQINKKKQQLKKQEQQRLKQKNKQIQNHLDKKRQQQQKQKKVRQNINKPNFKPKINKRQLSQAQKQAIQQNRLEKQRKKKQTQQNILRAQQQRKRKILSHNTKDKKLQIQGLDKQQILNRIDQIDLQDLLLDQDQKEQFRKQIKVNVNNVKQMKNKYDGIAQRQRAALQQQQKRIMDQKRRFKQKKQAQKVNGGKGQTFSTSSQKGQKSGNKNQLQFHKSKALRRYRAIMEGKQPLSQFDKYSNKFENNNNNDDEEI